MTTFASPPAGPHSLADGVTAPTVRDLVARRQPGRPLEAPFYVSRAFHDLDIEAVFARSWLYVAAEAQIPGPGDYITVDIGPYSVILVRGDDGAVRGLHNVCRHRGSRVLTRPEGSVGNIVCGYHQWTYATDGSLLNAGSQGERADASCLGLKPVALRTVGGLVFACLADDPPSDIDEVIGRLEPYVAPHRLGHAKVAAQEELIEDGNWKLVMENNRECYHCEAGHPELTCTFFPTYGYEFEEIPDHLLPAHARYLRAEAELERACEERGMPWEAIEEISGRPTAFRVQREALDGAGESYTLDGSAACRKLLGDFDTPRLGRLSIHLQPHAWFHLLADHAVASTVTPLAPDKTLVRTTWLVHEDAVEGVDYDLDTLTHVWHQTNAQDGTFVARAQAGVSDPAYEPGPYAPNEYQVDAFCTWYVERLEEYLRS